MSLTWAARYATERGYTIIDATPHMPKIVESLIDPAASEGFGNMAKLHKFWTDGSVRFDKAGERLLAAVDREGNVLGVGGLKECPDVSGAMRMHRFYTLPEARGMGIAKTIANNLIDSTDAHLITCNSHPTANAFWEKLGFQPIDGPNEITHILDNR